MRAGLLRTDHGVGAPDVPPEWEFGLPFYETLRENVARLSVESGLGDRVAWEASFSLEKSWKLQKDLLVGILADRRRRKARLRTRQEYENRQRLDAQIRLGLS